MEIRSVGETLGASRGAAARANPGFRAGQTVNPCIRIRRFASGRGQDGRPASDENIRELLP
jgi:hypothetical protein